MTAGREFHPAPKIMNDILSGRKPLFHFRYGIIRVAAAVEQIFNVLDVIVVRIVAVDINTVVVIVDNRFIGINNNIFNIIQAILFNAYGSAFFQFAGVILNSTF